MTTPSHKVFRNGAVERIGPKRIRQWDNEPHTKPHKITHANKEKESRNIQENLLIKLNNTAKLYFFFPVNVIIN